MKRTALTGLFLTAALLASPVFAAGDLCSANLQTLKDNQVSSSTNQGDDTKSGVKDSYEAALAAQKAGDNKKCEEITAQAISGLKDLGSGSDGGGNK